MTRYAIAITFRSIMDGNLYTVYRGKDNRSLSNPIGELYPDKVRKYGYLKPSGAKKAYEWLTTSNEYNHKIEIVPLEVEG